jgi:BirA family transcriptional regulator, biotin operon repressor / biotin---[acetyl-CoA-carboxylase] ligase
MSTLPRNDVALDVVDSTNVWAKKNISSFPSDKPTCITARQQTKGQGRFGTTWISPRDQNLYFSLVEKKTSPNLLLYVQAAALAIQAVLWDWQLPSRIKWPNDILVNDKKIAGILVEEFSSGGESWVILGIGININMPLEELQEIERPATSMKVALGTSFKIPSIQLSLKEKLLETLLWAKNNQGICKTRFEQSCSWIIGKEISIHTGPLAKISGIVQSITEKGHLQIKKLSGEIVEIATGFVEIA